MSICISGYHGKTTDFVKTSSCHSTTIVHFLNSGKWDYSVLSDVLKYSVIEIIYSEQHVLESQVFTCRGSLSYPEKAFGNSKARRAFLSTEYLSTEEILSYYVCQWTIEVLEAEGG